MSASTSPAPVSKGMLWTGRVLSALPVLVFMFSASMKFMPSPEFAEGLSKMGWKETQAAGLGVLELLCTAIYVVPQTSVLGAILLTGYLGGAVATHVRVGDPFTAAVVLGVLLWGGLFLREPRLKALLPLRR